jgi:malonyl-CoA O-methyltransferase
MDVEQAAVLSLLPPVAGRRVLDAGCGTGRYVTLLNALGARAVGIDLSSAMLGHARAVSATIARADLLALPLRDESCDVVVSGLAAMDVADLQAMVSEFKRVLRRGGAVVYSTLHPIGRARGWTRTFEARGHRYELAAHWHSTADHHRACERVGLSIDATKEPSLIPGGDPVALIIRATRSLSSPG